MTSPTIEVYFRAEERGTRIAKFGETRFLEYDCACSHFICLFVAGKLCAVRIVAQRQD